METVTNRSVQVTYKEAANSLEQGGRKRPLFVWSEFVVCLRGLCGLLVSKDSTLEQSFQIQ